MKTAALNGVTGHRGDPECFPENTLLSFKSAIEAGADWLELDARRCKDGTLVVSHDPDTGRAGDRALSIADSTLSELQRVDVACRFRKEHGLAFGDFPKSSIPALEDALRLVLSSGARVSIQPKDDCVLEALALARRLGAENVIAFNDGDLGKLQAAKRANPKIPIFYDSFDAPIEEVVQTALDNGFESVVRYKENLDGKCVRLLKEAKIEAGVWTVDDAAEMSRFLNLGVFRFYTNRPRALLKLKKERGLLP